MARETRNLALLGLCQGTPTADLPCVSLGGSESRSQARLPWVKIRKMERPPQNAEKPGRRVGGSWIAPPTNTRKTSWLDKDKFYDPGY